MKVQEVMTRQPVCCLSQDTVKAVARLLRDEDIGSMPVISDTSSRRLVGIITDRDLVCRIVSEGLDPSTTVIEAFMTRDPVACRPEQSLDSCEKLMQVHQIRRIPVVDREGRCIGILSQADMACFAQPERVQKTITEISRRVQAIIPPATAA
jgi:CBS domain-containing protein